MGKTVLILGNGFDLAHGLPTRYSDFLKFCYQFLSNPFLKLNIETWLNTYIEDINTKNKCEENFIKQYDYFLGLINGNVWYNFLYHQYEQKLIKGENWIDFESEISSVIQAIDKNEENLSYEYDVPLKDVTTYFSNDILYSGNAIQSFLIDYFLPAKKHISVEKHGSVKIGLKELRKSLYEDLENLTKALEIYLSLVEAIPIKEKLKDISNFYDHIINFNYTHTYQNYYGNYDNVFYIHGELNHKQDDQEQNNMVLGIDEYWSKKERNKHTNFTIFKKFAQRIQKRTGRDYFEIYNKLKNANEHVKIYFFGHSLDVTDKDILKMFLKDDSFDVTVYCMNKEAEGEYIANIIGIIGEKKLIYKVNREQARLEFKLINKEKESLTLRATP